MPNRLQKLLYYLSAESPILIVYAFVWIIKKTTADWKSLLYPCVLIFLAIVVIILFNRSFDYANKNLPEISINIIEINSDDRMLVAYVVSYLVPLISLTLNELIAPIAVIVFVLLMVVLTFTDYVSPHMILFFRGYHFYEVNVEGAQHNMKLVSRKRLRKIADVKMVNRVFEFLLIRR